jgi:hypothetical protein
MTGVLRVGHGGPGEPGPFDESPAVRRWLERAGDSRSTTDRSSDLDLLQRFCAAEGTTPDDLIGRCLRSTKSGGTAISTVGRRAIDQAIAAFAFAEGGSDRDAIVLGNRLRSFLIHNGIFLQGPASIV